MFQLFELRPLQPSTLNQVDHVPGVSSDESADVLVENRKRALRILVREAAQMRRNDHIFHRPQRVIVRERLLSKDVQRRAGTPATSRLIGSTPTTVIPKALHLGASAAPITPTPKIPTVLPSSSLGTWRV